MGERSEDQTTLETLTTGATTSKRPSKMLLIILVVIVALATAIIAFFIHNTTIDQQMRERAISDAKAGGHIEQLVIPSSWQDQTAFKISKVVAGPVVWDHNATPKTATIDLTANAENGLYECELAYSMRYALEDEQWNLVEQTDHLQSYAPMDKIPDEALLANLDRIIAETDDRYVLKPKSALAALFDAETTAEVVKNDCDDRHNVNATLVIHRLREGVQYDGTIDLFCMWDTSLPEGPDWKIANASADEETYEGLHSIPHEGLSWFRGAASIDQINAEVIPSTEYAMYIPTELLVRSGSSVARGAFENVPNNTVDLEFAITLTDTGETIGTTPRLARNTTLEAMRLNRVLEPGSYPARLQITAYSPNTNRIVGDSAESITVQVEA